MVKIDSIRHFLRHYALTSLMIGQKITYLHLYCHYISKNSLYYVNFLHHNKDAEPWIYSRLCVLRQFSAGTNLYLLLAFEFLYIYSPFFHLTFCVSNINLFFLIIKVSLAGGGRINSTMSLYWLSIVCSVYNVFLIRDHLPVQLSPPPTSYHLKRWYVESGLIVM